MLACGRKPVLFQVASDEVLKLPFGEWWEQFRRHWPVEGEPAVVQLSAGDRCYRAFQDHAVRPGDMGRRGVGQLRGSQVRAVQLSCCGFLVQQSLVNARQPVPLLGIQTAFDYRDEIEIAASRLEVAQRQRTVRPDGHHRHCVQQLGDELLEYEICCGRRHGRDSRTAPCTGSWLPVQDRVSGLTTPRRSLRSEYGLLDAQVLGLHAVASAADPPREFFRPGDRTFRTEK